MKSFLVLLAVVLSGFGSLFAQQSTVTCPKPVNLRLVGASQTSATLGWSLSDEKLGSPTKYYLTVMQGETVLQKDAVFDDLMSAREYQITGLTANTEYRVLLQSDCSSETKGKSEVSEPFTFKTLCASVGLPYSNDFESKDNPLPCWVTDYTGDTKKVNSRVYISDGSSTSGQSAYLYATSRQQAYIVTPQIDFAANNMQVSFYYYATKNVRFTAGVISDPYDMTTYVPLYNDSVEATKEWVEVRFNTASFSDAAVGKSIAIVVPSGTYVDMYIDNFSIVEKPICSRIERLKVDKIDSTSAVISWVDYENTGKYEVQVGSLSPVVATVNPYTISGLDKNTSYTVKVRNVCSFANSEWSSTVDFTTRCGIANNVEFLQDFEKVEVFPDCWFQENLKGKGNWKISTYEHKSGTRSISYSGDNWREEARSILVSQPIHVDKAGRYDFSFEMFRQWPGYETTYSKNEGEGVRVYISNTPDINDASAVELGMIHNHLLLSPVEKKVDGFYHYEYNISLSGTVYIIFEGVYLGGYKAYIDDIRVFEAPKCRPVRDIRVLKSDRNSIDITWDNHPASDVKNYKVDITTVPASSATVVMPADVNTNSYTITGLSPATTYTIIARVATNCSADGISEYTEQSLVYSTLCDATAKFPIKQNFDMSTFPPACWMVKQSVKGEGSDEDLGDNGWSWSNSENWSDRVYNGAGAAKLNICRKGTHTNLISPPFICGEVEKDFVVSFYQFRDYYGSAPEDGVKVWVNTTPDTVGGTLLKYVHTDSNLEPVEAWIADTWDEFAWVKYQCEFKGKGTMYVIFEGINDMSSSRAPSFIDDVNIYEKPSCDFMDINTISVDSIQTDAVRVRNSEPTIIDWSVSCVEKGMDPDNGIIVRSNNPTAVVKGLKENTYYDYYVKMHCQGGAASGFWCEQPGTFKTDCSPYVVSAASPFEESFELMPHQSELVDCYSTQSTERSEFVIDATPGAYDKKNALNVSVTYGNAKAWMFRSFNLKAGVSYALSAAVKPEYSGGSASFSFGIGNDAVIDSMKIASSYVLNVNDWQNCYAYITVPADGKYTIGWGVYFEYDQLIKLDNIKLEEASCIPPTDVRVDTATLSATSADILFNSTATEWELKVSSGEFDPETGVGDVFSGKLNVKNKNLTGLLPNTQYYYSLRSYCNGVPSVWAPVATFWTLCATPAIPWMESFDDPNGAMLNCWSFMSNHWKGEIKAYVDSDERFARSGYSLGMSEVTAISPVFDVTSLAEYELSGWVLKRDWGNAIFHVGVLNSSNPEEFDATFRSLCSFTISEARTWYDFSVRFDSILSDNFTDSYGETFKNAKQFVIFYEGTDKYLNFDNLVLEKVSSCSKVQDFAITAESSNGCTVDWNPGSKEAQWQLIAFNNGQRVADKVVDTHPYVIDFLNPLTEYELYIRSVCGVGDTSGMRFVGKFNTTCGSYQMPYDNTFDGTELLCWENGFSIPTENSATWKSEKGFMSIKTNRSGDMSSLYSPYISVNKGDNVLVSLDLNFVEGDSLGIYFLENDGQVVNRFTTPIQVIKTNGTQKLKYDVSKYLTGNYSEFRIALAAWNNKKSFEAYIDNFSIERVLPCVRPASVIFDKIGNKDVTVSFVDTVSTATAWQYVVVPMGSDINNTTPVDITSKTFTCAGLTSKTLYDVYIRTVCGNTFSDWRGPQSFITACDPMTFPYFQTFEDFKKVVDIENNCYTILNSYNQYDYPRLSMANYSGYAFEGKQALLVEVNWDSVSVDGKEAYSLIILPKFEGKVSDLKMKLACRNNAGPNACLVGVVKDPMNAASFMKVQAIPTQSDYGEYEMSFANINPDWDNGYIAIKVRSGKRGEIRIDNIDIKPFDFCDSPKNLTIVKTEESSAAFRWSIPQGVDTVNYVVETLDGQSVKEGKATSSVSITGLQAGTDYLFKVSAICSDTKSSAWTSIDFSTVQPVPALPYVTGFEASDDNDKWVIVGGEQVNKFMIGSDKAGVKEGVSALYISDDNANNHYQPTATSVVYAYRSLALVKGQYLISYDWKGVGDYNQDYARVYLAPIDMKCEAGKVLYSNGYQLGDQSYRLDKDKMSRLTWLDNERSLNRAFNWKQQVVELTIPSDTTVNLVVQWQNDIRSGSQTPFAFDNLRVEKVECPTLENLTIVSLSDNAVSATCSNMHEADSIIFAISTTDKIDDAILLDTIQGTNIVVANRLSPATEYFLLARTKCDALRNSAWISLPFMTQNRAATIPYSQTFEVESENLEWEMPKANTDVNYFIIGSAVSTSSLYVTDDGSSYNYNGAVATKTYAYRLIDMPKGLYNISYSWKCEGQISNGGYDDYARVFLAPANVIVEPGADLFSGNSLVTGAIALDNNALVGQKESTRTEKQILIREGGKYKLVVAWANDGNAKYSPVALDNIMITKLACARIEDVELTNFGTDFADVSFLNVNDSEVIYAYGRGVENISDIPAADYKSTTGNVIKLTQLSPDSRYKLFIKAKCSDKEESDWVEFVFNTQCTPDIVTLDKPYETSFEELAGVSSLDNCWYESAEPNNNMWVANGMNVSENRKPRTGKMNIVLESVYSLTKPSNHYAVRSFSLEGGKFYELSLWAIRSSDHTSYVEFVDCTADTVVLSSMELNDLTYSNLVGYFYAPTTGVYNLGFGVNSNSKYVSIDDYSVKMVPFEKPRELNVMNITKNTADVSWVVNAEKSHFELSYRGNVIFDTTLVGHEVKVRNLTAATNYTASVYGINNDGSKTETASTTFFTDCGVSQLPFMETFQNTYGSELPACWDNFSGTMLTDEKYNWYVASNGNSKFARISTSGAYGDAMLKTPIFKVDATDYALSFKYENTSNVDMKVLISVDGGKSFTETLATLNKEEWGLHVYKFNKQYQGKDIVVAFSIKSEAQGTGLAISLDDIRIARYGGETNLTDQHCSGVDYFNNGFEIMRADIKLGTNTFTKLAMYDINNAASNDLDTLKILTLNVSATKEQHIYKTICEGDVYNVPPFDGNNQKTESGDYVMTFTSSEKCDSNIILHLNVLPKMYYISDSICEGDIYTFGDQKCDVTGTYYAYGKNHLGCDSNVTLRLEVIPTHYNVNMNVCEGTIYEWKEAGQILTETGKYSHAFKNRMGCDSLVEINFVVIPTNVSITQTICSGSSIIFGDGNDAEEISKAGTYTKLFKNSLGCDSIVTLKLLVAAPIESVFEDFSCQDQTYTNFGFNVPVITQDTVLKRVIKNGDGCDSTIIVNVDFRPTIIVDSIASIVNGEEFEFCGTKYTEAGTYRCEYQTIDGCDSIVVLTLSVKNGVDNIMALPLVVAPNPIRGGESTYINREWTADEQNGLKVEILNSVGQIIAVDTPNYYPIEVNSIEVSGVYYVRVTSGTGDVYIGKLIVK